MIKCIENANNDITIGAEYDVRSWNDTKFYIYDDNGCMDLGGIEKTLFEYDKEKYN